MTREGGPFEDTVRLLGRELSAPQLATGIVLDRLVDVLLVARPPPGQYRSRARATA